MSPAPKTSQRGVPAAVRRVLQSGRVWTIQGVGTLLWLAVAYAYIRIGRANSWRLAASVVLAIFFAYLGAFLQRTALRVYRRERLSAARPGRKGGKVRHRKFLDWLMDAAIIFALFVALVAVEAVILQALPERLTSSQSFAIILGWLLFILFWLPLAAAALLGERSMWTSAMRAWRRVDYWLGTLICFVVADLAVWTITVWMPTGIEAPASVMLGLGALGYAIALGAWLVILALAEESISSVAPRSVDDTWD